MIKNENRYQILCMRCGQKLNKNQITSFTINKPKHSSERIIESSWCVPEMVETMCPYCRISDLKFVPESLADIIQNLIKKGYIIEKAMTELIDRDDCVNTRAIQLWFNASDIPFDLENTAPDTIYKTPFDQLFTFEKDESSNLIGLVSTLEPVQFKPIYRTNGDKMAIIDNRYKRLLHSLNHWVAQLPKLNNLDDDL